MAKYKASQRSPSHPHIEQGFPEVSGGMTRTMGQPGQASEVKEMRRAAIDSAKTGAMGPKKG